MRLEAKTPDLLHGRPFEDQWLVLGAKLERISRRRRVAASTTSGNIAQPPDDAELARGSAPQPPRLARRSTTSSMYLAPPARRRPLPGELGRCELVEAGPQHILAGTRMRRELRWNVQRSPRSAADRLMHRDSWRRLLNEVSHDDVAPAGRAATEHVVDLDTRGEAELARHRSTSRPQRLAAAAGGSSWTSSRRGRRTTPTTAFAYFRMALDFRREQYAGAEVGLDCAAVGAQSDGSGWRSSRATGRRRPRAARHAPALRRPTRENKFQSSSRSRGAT